MIKYYVLEFVVIDSMFKITELLAKSDNDMINLIKDRKDNPHINSIWYLSEENFKELKKTVNLW